MFSWPPATTMSESPLAIDCAASIAALRPEPQTLLMVIAGIMSGRPALIAAWRAGFWPTPARQHLADDHLGHLLRPHARALEQLPDHVRAEVGRRRASPALPPNLPMALRAAPTMTMSSMLFSWFA